MCGIALVIAGARLDLSSLPLESGSDGQSPPLHPDQDIEPVFSMDDLKAMLQRRGPDHFGTKEIYLQLDGSSQKIYKLSALDVEPNRISDIIVCDMSLGEFQVQELVAPCINSDIFFEEDERNILRVCPFITKSAVEMLFVGAVLQLRGINPVVQPLMDKNRNLLLFNGEIFGGMDIGSDRNDSEALMHALEGCCLCDGYEHVASCCHIGDERKSVPEFLSAMRGPWALIYWQASSRTLWFGRDAFGRRSLLVHWPTMCDPRFVLSSVSPPSSVMQAFDFEAEDVNTSFDYWKELSCGIYSISFNVIVENGLHDRQSIFGKFRKHSWTDAVLENLIKWERTSVDPKSQEVVGHHVPKQLACAMKNLDPLTDQSEDKVLLPVHKVLTALKDAVMRRTTLNTISQTRLCGNGEDLAPIAILFSGGLDSMIIAALLDQCLNSIYEIDLLSVSFDGQLAPDRISAKSGLKELQKIAPCRRWRLVEIDADLSNLSFETKHVMSLINPAKTYMDLNIGIALWLAAGGEGWVCEEVSQNCEKDNCHFKYKSKAKVLLVGSGADEQCAGYSRYRTKYRLGSWCALEEEMRLDMQRIWKRNLGRDDRCISDNGKEARFPFLDEDVIKTLLEIPLWEIADLDQPTGRGDKKILREVARLLGLELAATMPKRAIQFGSRIARESNRKNFGSNRAANMASAGSVIVRGL